MINTPRLIFEPLASGVCVEVEVGATQLVGEGAQEVQDLLETDFVGDGAHEVQAGCDVQVF